MFINYSNCVAKTQPSHDARTGWVFTNQSNRRSRVMNSAAGNYSRCPPRPRQADSQGVWVATTRGATPLRPQTGPVGVVTAPIPPRAITVAKGKLCSTSRWEALPANPTSIRSEPRRFHTPSRTSSSTRRRNLPGRFHTELRSQQLLHQGRDDGGLRVQGRLQVVEWRARTGHRLRHHADDQ